MSDCHCRKTKVEAQHLSIQCKIHNTWAAIDKHGLGGGGLQELYLKHDKMFFCLDLLMSDCSTCVMCHELTKLRKLPIWPDSSSPTSQPPKQPYLLNFKLKRRLSQHNTKNLTPNLRPND